MNPWSIILFVVLRERSSGRGPRRDNHPEWPA